LAEQGEFELSGDFINREDDFITAEALAEVGQIEQGIAEGRRKPQASAEVWRPVEVVLNCFASTELRQDRPGGLGARDTERGPCAYRSHRRKGPPGQMLPIKEEMLLTHEAATEQAERSR
jgi:hypothetical protein